METPILTTVPERITALRAAMRERHIAACIVPTADPHLSEYLPAHWQVREWLSGFTGSAGTLVVTPDFAGLWTDSRYFSQAERQLAGSGVELVKLNVPHTPEHVEWLCARLHAGDKVACAADMLSLATERALRRHLAQHGAELVEDDLPAAIWNDRASLPHAPVYEHPLEFAIRGRAEKLGDVRKSVQQAGATHHIVSALDEIAWVLNLRGSDVEYNPVFLAHLLIDASGATLFVDVNKLEQQSPPPLAGEGQGGGKNTSSQYENSSQVFPPSALRAPSPASGGRDLLERLRAEGVRAAPYESIADALGRLPQGTKLLIAPGAISAAVAHAIPDHVALIEAAGPIMSAKARKTAQEMDHVREAMRRDGVALVRGARWIEESLKHGKRLTELDIDEKLRELRAEQPGFVSESFSTIAGYEANAALPHYRAMPGSHAELHAKGMLLIDSGAQYLGGTTDITRMWALGETTPEQRRDVTLVLKGVIALSRAKFPRGTSGQQLDALARAPIWAAGVDYGHGTGHGVGYCLNVHEGPQSIRPPRSGQHLEAMDVGMITSIEPGIYKPGRHGVRIENLAATIPAGDGEFGEFLAFETLTLCPIDTRLLDLSLLDASETAWLDGYHATVRERLTPLLDDAADRAWLDARCAPLARAKAA
ncbi:MAG: Xaa-Pro aminopeptidase [Rhodanobacteraceae bacterium]|jgi:Xaa-Pro aminopeptidase|nr:MAG: Xaa-Pro aminopeptidase [Rhodanobacteraceae bacterium]